MPVKPWFIGVMALLPLGVGAADKPGKPDMDLLEFLGSIETRGNTGRDVLSAIDTELLPELPEEPHHDEKK